MMASEMGCITESHHSAPVIFDDLSPRIVCVQPIRQQHEAKDCLVRFEYEILLASGAWCLARPTMSLTRKDFCEERRVSKRSQSRRSTQV